MALKAGLGRTLAYTLEVALRRLDIPLENADLIALPVELKHAFLLDLHGFEQFFFFLLADLVRSTKTAMNLPGLAANLFRSEASSDCARFVCGWFLPRLTLLS